MAEARHLRRLSEVWVKQPIYFLTTCTRGREARLANAECQAVLVDEWRSCRERHGWAIGRYVIMPDHVHWFMTPTRAAAKPLSMVVGKWKEWTAKRVTRGGGQTSPLWQPEFFDHVLRSEESQSAKWLYVRENPVRAGLVTRAEDWRYAGMIDFE